MKPISDAVFTRCAVWERRNSLGLESKVLSSKISRQVLKFHIQLYRCPFKYHLHPAGIHSRPGLPQGPHSCTGLSWVWWNVLCWPHIHSMLAWNLSSACSEVSLRFVSLAQNGPLSWPPKGNIFTGILGHSRTFLHIVFYRTHDWLASVFYCRRS